MAFQRLHISVNAASEDRWRITHMTLEHLRSWATNLPDVTSQPMRWLFLSELNYGYIQVYSATHFAQTCPDYAKTCILEHTDHYTRYMSALLQTAEHSALYTSHDLLRASYVGQRLLDIIDMKDVTALGGPHGVPSGLGSETLPPTLPPSRSVDEVLNLALSCFDSLSRVLEHLCVQYGYPEPYSEFYQRSRGSIRRLSAQRLSLTVRDQD